MRKWLARFSFTFFVLAALCAWDAYKHMSVTPAVPYPRVVLGWIGAGGFAALGMAGVRARHRPD